MSTRRRCPILAGLRAWPQSRRNSSRNCALWRGGGCVRVWVGGGRAPGGLVSFFGGLVLVELADAKKCTVSAWIGLLAPATAFILEHAIPLLPVVRESLHTIALFLLCAACF